MAKQGVMAMASEQMLDWDSEMSRHGLQPVMMLAMPVTDEAGELHLFVPEGVPLELVEKVLKTAGLEVKRQTSWAGIRGKVAGCLRGQGGDQG